MDGSIVIVCMGPCAGCVSNDCVELEEEEDVLTEVVEIDVLSDVKDVDVLIGLEEVIS